MNIAYITSSPYSGSTLLSFLLNAHPQIGTISEFDIMDDIKSDQNYLCSCGEKLRECGFFSNLQKMLNEKGMEFKLDDMQLMFSLSDNERINRYLTQKLPLMNSNYLEKIRDLMVMAVPQVRKHINTTYSRNALFMESVLELSKSSVFLDANKNPYRLKYLNNKFDVNAIYLYKNGIAGAYSIYKQGRKSRKNPLTFKDACIRWFIEQITINRCLQSFNTNNIINLSYSDLCNNTESELNSIFKMLNLESFDVSSFTNSEHHIIGNAMRVSSIDSIQERKDWQENLTENDLSVYKQVLNKYSKKLAIYNDEAVSKLWS